MTALQGRYIYIGGRLLGASTHFPVFSGLSSSASAMWRYAILEVIELAQGLISEPSIYLFSTNAGIRSAVWIAIHPGSFLDLSRCILCQYYGESHDAWVLLGKMPERRVDGRSTCESFNSGP